MVCSVLSSVVLCHPGDSLRGRGLTHWTINTSPVSNWFPSDLFANANLLFMFLFLFTLYSHHEFNGCPWAAVAPCPALPSPLCSIYIYIFPGFLLPKRGGVNVFSFTQAHTLRPSPFSHRPSQSGNSSPFCAVLSLGFLLSASCFSLLAFCSFRYVFFRFLVSTACSFFHIVFRRSFSLPCKTHNNHFNFNAPIIWK